ncbi:MAG: Rieske 2Fe-2S domain-containing protein [Rhodospirillaceae bacterium]|nr:Rieske 2Fe-2S domain-containing protein [Rhodospirillaceae bacterium]
MTANMPISIERHTPDGFAAAAIDDIRPGVPEGAIFVARGALQAAGVFAPVHQSVFETLEELAGTAARRRIERDGLVRLHDILPMETLLQVAPLLQQRMHVAAGPIVQALATDLLRLGPDVHVEDTPNVRIIVPHDLAMRHEQALADYVRRRGRGGELTRHPPHQDSRHFHPTGAVNLWCAIDRVREGNGMILFPDRFGDDLPFVESDGGIAPGQSLGRPVEMALAPGDALVFAARHAHTSTINQTDETRFVVSFRLTLDTPHYRERAWYNYVRPAAWSADGPPRNPVDYAQPRPGRGPVSCTRAPVPPPAVAACQNGGVLEVAAAALPEGAIRAVSESLCVARIAGRPVAFARRCPHEGIDLAFGAVRDGRILCTWHGLRFDPGDGRSGCRSIDPLALHPCEERNGTIFVRGRPAG